MSLIRTEVLQVTQIQDWFSCIKSFNEQNWYFLALGEKNFEQTVLFSGIIYIYIYIYLFIHIYLYIYIYDFIHIYLKINKNIYLFSIFVNSKKYFQQLPLMTWFLVKEFKGKYFHFLQENIVFQCNLCHF